MDSEFPDPDEEFDLAHADEFELLNELEDFEEPTPKKISIQPAERQKPNNELSQHINIQNKNDIPVAQKLTNTEQLEVDDSFQNTSEPSKELTPDTLSFQTVQERETLQINNLDVTTVQSSHIEKSKKFDRNQKRTVDELMQDVTNILDGQYLDDAALFYPDMIEHKKKRPRWNQYNEVMEVILEERKKFNVKESNGLSYHHCPVERVNFKKDSVTVRVPSWNFVAVTRHEDGQRLYVRVIDDNRRIVAKTRPASGLLSVSYSQLKAEAEEIIVKNVQLASLPLPAVTRNESVDDKLWVDKYRPKKYMELLSDETINKSFLHWLKLWDKVVFHRDPIKHKRRQATENKKKFGFRNFNKQDSEEEVDSKGYPVYRIALLSGPPGLGKTTLAHVAARHAGYNVVEMNASDDREPSAFREALLSSTQMKAVIGSSPRPNCLVLDEIDGAPAASIDLLIKFVQGKLVQKGKRNKERMEKMKEGCKRPVICICNDLYAPALRQLKAMALVIPVPEVRPAMLADRLLEIAHKEGLKVELRDLINLAERSGCDIRTCLGALQYMGGANVKENLSLGLKDTRKGLFDSWKTLLQVPMTPKGILPPLERVGLVLKIVQQGESERLAQGVFHNYPTVCKEKLEPIARSLEWFQFFDEVMRLVSALQVWTIMPYTNYAFVVWHFDLASSQNPILSYPMAAFEMKQKLGRNLAILTSSQKSCGIDKLTLVLDIAPLLPEILTPRLRSVSAHLYSPKEKSELMHLINVMLDYGLTLIQEKKPEGGFEYHLEPDLFGIGTFPDCKFRRGLSYAVKQIVIQELEAERVKRAAAAVSAVKNQQQAEKSTEVKATKGDETKVTLPNHLKQQLEPVAVKPIDTKFQDFFQKFRDVGQTKFDKEQQSMPSTTGELENEKNILPAKRNLFKKDVWYKFKEGFTNAVRRNIRMEDLL